LREWPSIVPGAPEDYYVVVNHYGRFGAALAETSLDRADLATTIADLMAGLHRDPRRVVLFNTDTDRADDVIAQERMRCPALKGATCRQSWRTSSTAMSVETAN
jgi:hypothetical protein